MDKKDLRIVYLGTPEFAVAPLKKLVEQNYNIVGVITNPDKPAGRGQKMQESAVKQYAISKNLTILQPEKFKDPEFIKQLYGLKADIQIIVAFKMLPEVVWSMPRLGTFNLHASLLPQYRGAAPINWAIINGEKVTGLTTFFLKHEIDTGNIIFREEVPICENDNAGLLHDKLMEKGANLVVKTIESILKENYPQINQNQFTKPNEQIRPAPKIFKNDCRINWNRDIYSIYNHIRGLSPYPAAWTELSNSKGESVQVKIFETRKELLNHSFSVGEIITDNKAFLKVAAIDGFIDILKLQLAGKKTLQIDEFLRGFQNISSWHIQ
ncbi:MAG: methionyl-tRNA formyltransferase [Bacteroidetes bacterium GWF2_33_16]|nr:MAG: methionyl-tRNA formyltransferase [Bacteroidetes bacterium GWE2_32_14]OFY04889.1 MAG: methionyl-tRNA formyltransferase [Bacteroidetes bacterium GWF2_33_16]